MSFPTTGVLFSGSEPEPDPGNQLCTPKTDGGQPAQIVSFQPKIATEDLAGVGRPDGVTLQVDENGVWSTIPFGGSGGGSTGGGTSASGGQYVCVVPTPDPADGTGTQFILPAPILAGTVGLAYVNGVLLDPLTAGAEYAVQGTQLTTKYPVKSDDKLRYYYIQGTPNSETGGGGSVTPVDALAAWPMDEGSGLTLHDVSGNGDDASAASIAWQVNPGFPGITPKWTGAAALTSSSTLTNFDGTTPFSVALWATATSNQVTMLGTLNTASNDTGWEVGWGFPGPSIDFFLINTYPTNAIDVKAPTSLSSGDLCYIVVTYDGSKTAAGVKIYANGVLLTNTVALDSLTGSAANGLPITFGVRKDASDGYGGVMAFVEIWGFVLSPEQVSDFYAKGPQLN